MDRDQKERLLLDLLPNIRPAARLFARRFSLDKFDCEQEACLAAWKAIELFDETRGFKLWTYVARWVDLALLNFSRRKWRIAKRERPERTDLFTMEDHHRDWSPLEFNELTEPCRPRDRDIIRELYVAGFTQAEIGERDGVSHQCIGQIHRRALVAIRARELSK